MKNKLYSFLYKLFYFFYKEILPEKIVGKLITNSSKKIYYERSQFLNFLFQKKINYEQEVWDNILPNLKASNLIFDVGANIGQYALRFSEITGEKGKVICLEPDYKNFAFLQFNTMINNCKNIECLKMGLSDKNEKIEFYRDTQTGGRMGSFNRKFVQDKYKGFTDVVTVNTYEEITQQYGTPDFVKIDVEGFELNIIKGIKNFDAKTKYLIEVREETKFEIFNTFYLNGFNCFIVDYKKKRIMKNSSEIPSFANLLFIKNK